MAELITTILGTTKKGLGLTADYDVFDAEIMMHINSVLATLNQLGVGPDEGFSIEDGEEEWEDFLGEDPLLNSVKSYMVLKVRLLFDVPTTSFAISAFEKQVDQYEWRFSVYKDSKDLKASKL